MSLTLGLTGMDPATEAALKSAFEEANARLQGRWRLASEAEADHVVVDMDSMYGPMSWLRLHAAGKHVIGLTSAARTQTDFRLGRPFDSHQVARLLEDVARQDGVALSAAAPLDDVVRVAMDVPAMAAPPDPAPAARPPTPVTAAAVVDRQGDTRTGAPAARVAALPDASPPAAPAAPVTAAGDAPSRTVDPAARDDGRPVRTADATAETPAAVDAVDATASAESATPAIPEVPPRQTVFADWLLPGALSRRVRYRRESGPTLLIDPIAQVWHGPTPLKPITAYFEGHVRAEDFEAVDDATWANEHALAGPAQSLVRLRWLGGLVAGRGRLLPGLDPDGRYVLNKWPQTEREYPKHFRIATAMMKGPSRLPQIAAASGLAESEVADFINANLATGFAEFVPDPPPQVEEPPRPTSLLGRLRNR